MTLNDVKGELGELVGVPITVAIEEWDSKNDPPEHADSFTWTYCRLKTSKGEVQIRWLGESNGCYSETVDFEEAKLEPADADHFLPDELKEAPVFAKHDWLLDHGHGKVAKVLEET